MDFNRLNIPDVILCKPQIHGDERGYFIETFRQDKLEAFIGQRLNFCQDNESLSSRGVLRGLHYQLPPFAQTKLVRVVRGAVLDVVVDIRAGSPTFGQHVSVELNAENKLQLFVPRGFAHGFVVLEPGTIFAYKVDNYYNAQCDRGIAFNDPDLRIDWRVDASELKLSAKDLSQQRLFEAKDLFRYGDALYE